MDLDTATIQITGNYVDGEDVLSFSNTATINGSFDSAAGILTLSGTDSVANYQAALRSVTYENLSDNPQTAAKEVTFIVSDGDADSNAQSRDISIVAVNDAPTLATIEGQAASYTENTSPIAVTSNLSIADVDDSQIESATITISSNFSAAEDILNFTDQSGIVGNFANGTLTLSGSASIVDYEAAVRSVTYNNIGENPSALTRTIEIVVNDGDTNSNQLTRDIEIIPVNDAPTLSTIEGQPVSYTENTSSVAVTNSISISDVDDTQIESATVTIGNNFSAGEDVLNFTDQLGITGSFTNGILTLTGSASIVDYETAIRSITYNNTSEDPSALTRTVDIVVNDGDTNSNQLSRDIEIIPVNDAPAESAIESLALVYTENSGPSVITSTLALSDIDDVNLESASIQINVNYVSGEDVLSFSDTATISSSFDPLTGILTLTGTDTVANYQAALRSVAYENLSSNPQVTPKTVTFSVSDGDVDSNVQSRDISIVAINNAPTVASIEVLPASFTENTLPVAITSSLSIADVDDLQIESAIVTISNNFIAGEDVLNFTDQLGISGSFSSGTLTLTGSASIADYEAAIRSVTYENTSENPSALTRTVEIAVNDGDTNSNLLSRDINVFPVNDVPIESVIEQQALVYVENSGQSIVTNTLSLFDIDNINLNTATVQVSGNYVPGEDVLSFADTSTISSVWDPVTGTLTLNGLDTVASYQAALQSVTYENTSDNPSEAQRTIEFTVVDTAQGVSNSLSR